jgi:hypothetical protein
MAHCGFGEAPLDMRRGREGRVHEHHAWADRRIKPVMDLLGIVAGDRNLAEQPAQEVGAHLSNLVEDELSFRELGEDRQEARPGRRFEDDVAGNERCGLGRYEAERDGRRELLELFGFLRAAGLRGMRAASRVSISSIAAGEPARERIAAPNLRRNMTCAASHAS